MKKVLLFFALIFLLLNNSCIKKEVNLEVKEIKSETEIPIPRIEKETFYVLGLTPQKGWLNDANVYAEDVCREIRTSKDGKYNAVYMNANSIEEQIIQLKTIVSNGDAKGIVFISQEIENIEVNEILNVNNIPYIVFNQVDTFSNKNAILNVCGDNVQSGAGVAYWLQKKGMKKGDILVTFVGDSSDISLQMQEGFDKFLLGELKYNDKIENDSFHTDEIWTKQDLDALKINFNVVCDWSKKIAKEYFAQNMKKIVDFAKKNGNKIYVYSMDDDFTLEIIDILKNKNLVSNIENDIESMEVYVASVGSKQEICDIMNGNNELISIVNKFFDDMMSIYCTPKMVKNAIYYMIDYCENNWPYDNGYVKYEPVWIVKKNVLN